MRQKKQNPAPDLAEIRRQIDKTDEALLDLMAKRAVLVNQVANAKAVAGAAGILRPAREAAQMRQFIAWHKKTKSPIPLVGLLAIWREIISASISQQAPLGVHIGGRAAALAALGRAQFGGAAAYHIYDDAHLACQAVRADRQSVAVLPLAGEGAGDWWRDLPDGLKIFTRLPLVPLMGGAEDIQALCLGHVALEPSGDDVALITGAAAGVPDGAQILAQAGGQCLAALDSAILAEGSENITLEQMTGAAIFDSYTLIGLCARISI